MGSAVFRQFRLQFAGSGRLPYRSGSAVDGVYILLRRLLAAGIAALAFAGAVHAEPTRFNPAIRAKIDTAAEDGVSSGRVAGAASTPATMEAALGLAA